jgi:5-methylcytosine-specific restriction endonuclease McrA
LSKKEYPRNDGQWTEARFNSFVKGGLRAISQRWPPKYTTLAKAFREQRINVKSGRLAKHYECQSCKNLFPQKDVEVNHRIPIIPTTGFDSWTGVIERMFCDSKDLEVLCKPCHKAITQQENKERKENING